MAHAGKQRLFRLLADDDRRPKSQTNAARVGPWPATWAKPRIPRPAAWPPSSGFPAPSSTPRSGARLRSRPITLSLTTPSLSLRSPSSPSHPLHPSALARRRQWNYPTAPESRKPHPSPSPVAPPHRSPLLPSTSTRAADDETRRRRPRPAGSLPRPQEALLRHPGQSGQVWLHRPGPDGMPPGLSRLP